MKIYKGALPLILVGIGLFAGAAWAAPIVVANFSFESPETGNGGGNSALCPTSWTCTPAADGTFHVGVFSPSSPGQYNNTGTDGLPAGHTVPLDGSARTNNMNTSGGYEALYMNPFFGLDETVSQNTAALIANNTTYTLDAWIGHEADRNWGNARFRLTANGVTVADTGLLTDPGSGQWAEHSLTFNSGTLFSGQTLGIALLNFQPGGFATTNFDLVTLNDNSVPEPTTLLLLGTGLVALGLFRRRKAV